MANSTIAWPSSPCLNFFFNNTFLVTYSGLIWYKGRKSTLWIWQGRKEDIGVSAGLARVENEEGGKKKKQGFSGSAEHYPAR
jgi:hypothetical protein